MHAHPSPHPAVLLSHPSDWTNEKTPRNAPAPGFSLRITANMMFDAMITPASGWGSAEIAWRICMASAAYLRHYERNDGRFEEPIDRGVVQRKISTELHMAERRKTAARKASRGTVAKKSSAKKSSAKKSSPKRW